MPEFKIGDVVRLKSGGPAMTVCGRGDPKAPPEISSLSEAFSAQGGDDRRPYRCKWMTRNNEADDEAFPGEALMPHVEPPVNPERYGAPAIRRMSGCSNAGGASAEEGRAAAPVAVDGK